MSLFSIEYSRLAYRADFAVYALAVLTCTVWLALEVPAGRGLAVWSTVVAGLAAWTFVEYALHRFVLHGLPPFQAWHARHHTRPAARMGTPTLLSLALFGLLVFTPALLVADLWLASGFTLGLLAGYLGYSIMHHVLHHGTFDSVWLRRRRRVHARHHRPGAVPGYYGVTSSIWDDLLGSRPPPQKGSP